MDRILFKYHPNLYESGILNKRPGVCQCCGKPTRDFCEYMYTEEDVDCICLSCVADGSAAEKFKGTYIQDAETDKVSDPAKTEELFKRTPGYISWQGEYWLACCDDYCEFVGDVGTKELEDMGIADEVFERYEEEFGDIEDLRSQMIKNGMCSGYLFRCPRCGKYRLYADIN